MPGLKVQAGLESGAMLHQTFGRDEPGNQFFHKWVNYISTKPDRRRSQVRVGGVGDRRYAQPDNSMMALLSSVFPELSQDCLLIAKIAKNNDDADEAQDERKEKMTRGRRPALLRAIATLGASALFLAGCTVPRLPAFERALTAQDSATAALGEWCAANHLANPARITASPMHDADAPPPADLRSLLSADPKAAIGYRHVRLSCGSAVLSEAHNWFLPSRLTPAMNATLASTDTPFGKVAGPLRFTRQRLDSRRGRASACPAHTVLSHRALLRLPGGAPLALVVECYTAANLHP